MFRQPKFENPKMKQSELAEHLDYSSSTLKRYRKDIKMLSPYRTNTTNKRGKEFPNKNFDDKSHREHEHKRSQMSPNEPKRPQMTSLNLKLLLKIHLIRETKIF